MENTYREVLLISEDYIKSESLMDDNLSPKYLLTAIKLSQDVEIYRPRHFRFLPLHGQAVHD